MLWTAGELAVDAEHGPSLGDHEPGEVFCEVSPLAFVGEEVAEPGHGVLHDLGNSTIPGMSRCSALPLGQAKSGRNRLHLPYSYRLDRAFA